MLKKALVRLHDDADYKESVWWEQGVLRASTPSLQSVCRSFQSQHGDNALEAIATFDNGYWYGEAGS